MIPSNRAMKIVDIAKKKAVPLLFRVTPSDGTNLEIRSSHFTLLIMHWVATRSAIALKLNQQILLQVVNWYYIPFDASMMTVSSIRKKTVYNLNEMNLMHFFEFISYNRFICFF